MRARLGHQWRVTMILQSLEVEGLPGAVVGLPEEVAGLPRVMLSSFLVAGLLEAEVGSEEVAGLPAVIMSSCLVAGLLEEEVARRLNPARYSHLWGRPLKEVRGEIASLGRPLAPQSIRALDDLFRGYDAAAFDEAAFVEAELHADAALYRDPLFLEGLSAMIEQRVPRFRFAPSCLESSPPAANRPALRGPSGKP